MTVLGFEVDGASVAVEVRLLLNAGYAGRAQEEVAAHVAELAELGVPAPAVTPALYPIAPYLASQADAVPAQHGRTSGEAEWALVVTDDDVLLTAACDHTDRALEEHGVAWSKNAGPDVLARRAWRLAAVAERLDELTLRAWVTRDGREEAIQASTAGALLPPSYWLEVLRERGLDAPGTVLLSGTVAMLGGVDPFADAWRVALGDPATGDEIALSYRVDRLPEPIG